MSKLDNQYRAFKDYRKTTKVNLELTKDRKTLMDQDQKSDYFSVTKFLVHIDEDWIKEIEAGLEFVEKALAEERQFIRVDGEIVPIEKVKKVGRSSVEYLAKHANMITHLPEEGKDLTPDELYITEKNADYAVYENRFLYLLLIYLQEFVFFRLDKIEKLRSTYESEFKINKKLELNKREVIFESRIFDKRSNNPYPLFDEVTEDRLKRMRDISSIVSALLNTQLMIDVSKTPLIKPPITKTNVLKMNNNFKKALALYEYISAYNTPGYTFEEVKKDLTPLTEINKDELAEPFILESFLTYKIGNDIEETLSTEYENEERKKKEEEAKELDERIRRLKKKAADSQKTMEEYMALLEIRNQQLLKDSEDLSLARDEINKLNQEIDKLNLDIKELYRRIDNLENIILKKDEEIARLNQKYHDDMAELKRKHAKEIKELNLAHSKEIDSINKLKEEEISAIEEKCKDEIKTIKAEAKEKIESTENSYHDKIENARILEADLNEKLQTRKAEINDLKIKHKEELDNLTNNQKAEIDKLNETHAKKVSKLEKDYDQACQDRDLYLGELTAIKVMRKEISPSLEFASRQRFTELEREYKAFERFFNDQWKITKKKIEKDIEEEILAKSKKKK